jgi:hypothetical protein
MNVIINAPIIQIGDVQIGQLHLQSNSEKKRSFDFVGTLLKIVSMIATYIGSH